MKINLKKPMPHNKPAISLLIKDLIPLLPRHAEEGNYSSSFSRDNLKQALKSQRPLESDTVIDTALDMVETILISGSLLCKNKLIDREWQFVSHSAQLCATSILHTLAAPDHQLLSDDFWHTQFTQGGNDKFQEQKKVLMALENCRAHDNPSVEPIRYIYVAWGVIKLGEKFLFYKREAKEHNNHFGLIGGRVNVGDLPVAIQDLPVHEKLQFLQSSALRLEKSILILDETLDKALHRELKEEANLDYGVHYQASRWIDITPWQGGMGSAPHYAQTQYFIYLYTIELNILGYLTLCTQIAQNPGDFLLCSVEEVVAKQSLNGNSILNIPAVVRHFEQNNLSLAQEFKCMAQSYLDAFLYNGHGLIFGAASMQEGVAGGENTVELGIDPAQYALLLGLAGHAKGFAWSSVTDGVHLYELGWISVAQGHPLCGQLNGLIAAIQGRVPLQTLPAKTPDDDYEQRFFRLSADPAEHIFFDPGFHSYQITNAGNNYALTLKRACIATGIGVLSEERVTRNLTQNFGSRLRGLFGHDLADDPIAVINPHYTDFHTHIRHNLKNTYRPFGLRRLLCTISDNGEAYFTRYVTTQIKPDN